MKATLILLLIIPFGLFGQGTTGDKVKIKLMADKEPLRGATLLIKGSNPPQGTTSDMNGEAELLIPQEFKTIEISFLGPYTALEIIRPVDSIYFDISSKTATYYLNKKKLKRKKQIVNN
ncbi:MAG: hypothetical protein JST46_18040 [Bacteroidetes bacterium]|nr:hypothetical protein [Bacteroidota bacterium]